MGVMTTHAELNFVHHHHDWGVTNFGAFILQWYNYTEGVSGTMRMIRMIIMLC